MNAASVAFQRIQILRLRREAAFALDDISAFGRCARDEPQSTSDYVRAWIPDRLTASGMTVVGGSVWVEGAEGQIRGARSALNPAASKSAVKIDGG
ncbi:MAG: hypothetical protein HQ478_03670 [Chloroflexi bacterium]|nr:hypothetical protein [Chloroflexota bacterium]